MGIRHQPCTCQLVLPQHSSEPPGNSFQSSSSRKICSRRPRDSSPDKSPPDIRLVASAACAANTYHRPCVIVRDPFSVCHRLGPTTCPNGRPLSDPCRASEARFVGQNGRLPPLYGGNFDRTVRADGSISGAALRSRTAFFTISKTFVFDLAL